MAGIVKIDDEVFTTEDFIKLLKLNGRFENLMEDILRDRLAVQAAKRAVELSPSSLQLRELLARLHREQGHRQFDESQRQLIRRIRSRLDQ